MNEAEKKTSSLEAVNSVDLTAKQTIAPIIVPVQTENREIIDYATFSSRFAVRGNCLAAIAPPQRLEIITLVQALSSSNNNLSERVSQLEQALTECLEALQLHKKRSRVAELMVAQKNDEIAAVQEQIKTLSQETATTNQTIQRQQTLIESLTAQLQSSQERSAQLEWEHYLIQASHTEQSQQLIQTENTCRELRTRLKRQQQYTLQLKVALEKCLESSSSYQSRSADLEPIQTNLNSEEGLMQLQSLFSKDECIPPWSAQPHFPSEVEPNWAESSFVPNVETSYYHSSISDWSNKDLITSLEAEFITPIETDEPTSLEEAVIDRSDRSSSLEQSELISTTTLEIHPANQDAPAEELQLQNLRNLLEIEVTTNSLELTNTVASYSAISASVDLVESFKEPLDQDLLDTGESISSDDITQSVTQSPQQTTNSFTPNSNWPSPLVYPSHPHKPKKSLAAIELPTFT